MSDNQKLKDRIDNYLNATGATTAAFARRVNLSTASIFKWRRGALKLSDASVERIDRFLNKFGF